MPTSLYNAQTLGLSHAQFYAIKYHGETLVHAQNTATTKTGTANLYGQMYDMDEQHEIQWKYSWSILSQVVTFPKVILPPLLPCTFF